MDSSTKLPFRLRPADIWPIIRSQLHIIVICAVLATIVAFVATLFVTKEYRASAVLELLPRMGQEVKVQQVVNTDVRGYQEIERFYRSQLQLMRTRSLADVVVKRYRALGYDDLPEDDGKAANRILSMVRAYARERSQLVDLEVTHSDPERARVIANLVAHAFEDENLEARRQSARGARTWLQKKLVESEQRMADTGRELLEFKEAKDMVDAEEAVTALSARMQEIDQSYGEVATKRVLQSTELDAHKVLLAKGRFAELAEVLATPSLQALARVHAEAKAEDASLAAKYGEKHPERTWSTKRLERIERDLERETRNAIAAGEARLAMLARQEERLKAENEQTKAELLAKQTLMQKFRKLKQAETRAQAFHATLSERSDELDLSSETQLNNVRVVDDAETPQTHIYPKMWLNLVLGLFGGCLAGATIAFLRFYFDDRVRSPTDISTYIDAPFLGIVPHVAKIPGLETPDLSTHVNPRSAAAEAVRGLRTVLELNPSGRAPKRILVTSSVKSEGKTSTAVRLGIAFANAGKRVVLVEADHRRARLHKAFNMDNPYGVTDVLVKGMPLAEAVRPTAVDNLFLLSKGDREIASTELLGSGQMESLLDDLDELFDLVILDTSPSASLAEGVSLSRMVDGVILIVRAGVSRTVVRHTLSRFGQVDAKILGLVLNDVRLDRWTTRYGSYGYNYYYYAYDYDDGDRSAAK